MNNSATLTPPATFIVSDTDRNVEGTALPTLPSQIAFRVAQMGQSRAAIRQEPHIELGFDASTGLYHVAVSEQTTRF